MVIGGGEVPVNVLPVWSEGRLLVRTIASCNGRRDVREGRPQREESPHHESKPVGHSQGEGLPPARECGAASMGSGVLAHRPRGGPSFGQ